ncbi:unnamed protein product [Protopolystoma xenopodis]|uniref:Axin beta-catenin binding domain-containing protein n=1 Tax=Protopolystoma xenopodis TaxID=117903 RepID=A0A448WGG0_9PLAT|nr:unnamed protein product [Protopolystoma xenopodis]
MRHSIVRLVALCSSYIRVSGSDVGRGANVVTIVVIVNMLVYDLAILGLCARVCDTHEWPETRFQQPEMDLIYFHTLVSLIRDVLCFVTFNRFRLAFKSPYPAKGLDLDHSIWCPAILEDHCSRIWAASADRTPTSSGGGSGNDGIQTVSVSCAGTLSGNGYSFGPTGAGGPIVKVPSTSGPCLLPRCSSCQPANTIAANPLPTWLISAPLSLPPQIHSLAPLPSSTTNDVFNPPRSASSSQQHVFLLQQDSRPPVPSYTSFIPGASQKQTGFHVTPNTECPDCATSPLRLATARGYRYSQRRQQPRARLRRRSPAVANTNANHASIATTCTLGCRPSSGNVAFTLASQIEAAWPHRDILLPHPNEMSRSAPTEHGPSVNTCDGFQHQ